MLERHGFAEEAAEHYLEGRQYDDVVRLIENNLDTFIYKKSATLSVYPVVCLKMRAGN